MIADLDGPVHYVAFDGPADGPAVVYVHGLGGSHLNWNQLAPKLAGRVRGYALDLAGFGRTEALGRATTVRANAALLRRFIDEVVGEPVVLIGNSMGGTVSLLVTETAPQSVTGLVLIDPVLPLAERAQADPAVRRQFFINMLPGIGERQLRKRLATVPARDRVNYVLALCYSDPSRILPEIVEAGVALEEERVSHTRRAESYLSATRSMLMRVGRSGEYWRRMAGVRVPVLLIHGTHDRLVPVESARAAAQRLPQWQYAELDAGHVPQMETPDEVAALIEPWLFAETAESVKENHA